MSFFEYSVKVNTRRNHTKFLLIMTFSDLVAPQRGQVAPNRAVCKLGFQHVQDLVAGPLT